MPGGGISPRLVCSWGRCCKCFWVKMLRAGGIRLLFMKATGALRENPEPTRRK